MTKRKSRGIWIVLAAALMALVTSTTNGKASPTTSTGSTGATDAPAPSTANPPEAATGEKTADEPSTQGAHTPPRAANTSAYNWAVGAVLLAFVGFIAAAVGCSILWFDSRDLRKKLDTLARRVEGMRTAEKQRTDPKTVPDRQANGSPAAAPPRGQHDAERLSNVEHRLRNVEDQIDGLVSAKISVRTTPPASQTPSAPPWQAAKHPPPRAPGPHGRQPIPNESIYDEPSRPTRTAATPAWLAPERLMDAIIQAIADVASTGTSLTEANAANRILTAVRDPAARQQLAGIPLSVDFFDAGGQPSVQAPELMSIQIDSSARRYVVPFPHAGRAARFLTWFGTDDYRTEPVLARRAAIASMRSDGQLVVQQPGYLVEA